VVPGNGAEARIVITGFLLLFCVLGGYFAVRPVRETIGTMLGREATQNLWFFTALFAILIVPFYGWLVARVRRSVLLPSIYGSCRWPSSAPRRSSLGTPDPMVRARVLRGHQRHEPAAGLGRSGASCSRCCPATRPSACRVHRRGRYAGALVGPGATALFVKSIGNAGVLYLGAGMYLVAIVLSRVLLAQWRHVARRGGVEARPALRASRRRWAAYPFAGFMLVLRNPYLLGIALFIAGISAIQHLPVLRAARAGGAEVRGTGGTHAGIRQPRRHGADAGHHHSAVAHRLHRHAHRRDRACWPPCPSSWCSGSRCTRCSARSASWRPPWVLRRWGEYALIRPGRENAVQQGGQGEQVQAKNVCDVAVYRIADAGFAQLKKLLDAVGMGGTAQALIAAAVAALVGLQRLVAWASASRRKKRSTGSGA
jgi:AAA family ATP:ADP antiporter